MRSAPACGRGEDIGEAWLGEGLTAADAEHAAGCASCGRAIAEARRFAADLDRVGLELAAAPGSPPADVVGAVSTLRAEVNVGWRQILVGFAVVATIVAVAVGPGLVVGELGSGGAADSSASTEATGTAASIDPSHLPARSPGAVGAGRDGGQPVAGTDPGEFLRGVAAEVLVTEDGALGVIDRGLALDLVLVTRRGDGLVAYRLGTAGNGLEDQITGSVTCSERSARLQRTSYAWGRIAGAESIEGPGVHVLGESGRFIFAFDRDAINGQATATLPGGAFGVIRNDSVEACFDEGWDGAAPPLNPGAMTCVEWLLAREGAQRATVEFLIGPALWQAVREAHDLPLSATLDDLHAAAWANIDKQCLAANAAGVPTTVSEVIESRYGQ